jgi:hypothetical protein
MEETKYVKLTGNYFFDPVQKIILKKQGGRYITVLHDRRRSSRPVPLDRRKKEQLLPGEMKQLGQGLYWDLKSKDIYRKAGGKLVLFTRDRRKNRGPQPVEKDRREPRV